MKQLFTLLAITLFGAATWSCSYDDDDLWKEIDGIKTQLAELNKEVSALQTLVDALRQSKTISDVTQTDTGYTITFNDNTSVSIADGKNGTNAPEVGIDLFEGGYYWTIGGKGNWLTDADGHKIPVAGKDGSKPEMAVDADGYWIVDGARIKDAAGNDVKATGSNGKDGDSFFKSVSDGDDAVTFTLTDGTEIVIPKTSVSSFCFVQPDDGRSYFVFDFGKKKTLTLNTTDVETADFMNIPAGWKASLNLAKNSVTVQAPAASDAAYSGGIITLIGIDKKGNTVFASADVCASVDYTDKDGTFVVCEGNMTSVNGMLVYYDKAGKEYREVFEQANGGLEIGNVVQDMFMANGKIYLLTQNGDRMGGAGRFVVCDARTMRMEFADPLVFKTPEDKDTWPQHLVVVSATKAYIQYSDSSMESTSGIVALTLGENSVQIGATLEGTFGAFTSVGAIKTRMVYSRGKIYAGCGHSVVIINAESGTVEKRLTYEGRQVKGIVKGVDGNIYFALAGTYSGTSPNMGTLTSDPMIVGIDHSGTVVSEKELSGGVRFPIATWSPAIGMCASFTDPYLYFVDTDAFNATSATRYNYQTQTVDYKYLSGNETIYGIMGQHPTTNVLWVGKSSYVDSNIYTYDVSGTSASEINHFYYPTQKGASPAGIDFVYRFSEAYINK